jgi:hypothetical protein
MFLSLRGWPRLSAVDLHRNGEAIFGIDSIMVPSSLEQQITALAQAVENGGDYGAGLSGKSADAAELLPLGRLILDQE